jgi:tryptophanyl-tRNA synthetase
MGLDGQAKMSKSIGNHLGLLWDDATIREKLKPAFTDPARLRRKDPGNPEICNIFTMHQGFSDEQTVSEMDAGCRSAGIGCFDCKTRLADSMTVMLGPVREKADVLGKDHDTVRDILSESARFCREVAADTMGEVREVMGLR